MNNATINAENGRFSATAITIPEGMDIEIIVPEGTTSTLASVKGCGIEHKGADVTISGIGTLNIEAYKDGITNNDDNGVSDSQNKGSTLTIQDVKLNLTSTYLTSVGIREGTSVSINNAIITAIREKSYSSGNAIYADDEITIKNSQIDINGYYKEGIAVSNDLISIENSEVNMEARHGMQAYTYTSIKNSTLILKSSQATENEAIFFKGQMIIEDSTVDIDSAAKYGIYSTSSKDDNSGTTMIIKGNSYVKSKGTQCGIYLNNAANMSIGDQLSIVEGKILSEKNPLTTTEVFVVIADADYTKVDAALDKVPTDLNLYTDKSVKALDEAIDAVDKNKKYTEQTTVDGYAKAIEDAISQLEYKDADYTKVNDALEVIKKLNKDNYVDFSEVEKPVNNVVQGKKINEQKIVDGYAVALETAINNLEYKKADYESVNNAISIVEQLNKNNYKDFSKVEAAIEAIIKDKDITDQAMVDEYAKAIEEAIAQLEYKDANYIKVDQAINKVPTDLSVYTDESVKALNEAINAVKKDKNITEQDVVDEYAVNIETAIKNLKLKTVQEDKPTDNNQQTDHQEKEEPSDVVTPIITPEETENKAEETENKAEEKTDQEVGNEKTNQETNKAVKTDDDSQLLMSIGMMLIAGGYVYIETKRRNKCE